MSFNKKEYSIEPVSFESCYPWIMEKHYARRMPSISHKFGLFHDGFLCGVCTFGSGANRHMKGMVDGFDAIELNRLIIDEAPRNALSFFVAGSLSLLPKPLVVVSYADPNNGHHGYIYQSTNWIYTGKGTRRDGGVDSGVTQFIKNGINYHGKSVGEMIGSCSKQNADKHGFTRVFLEPKHRYLFLLGSKTERKRMKARIPYPVMKYPKGDNTRYDTGKSVETQGTLFS